MTGQPQLCLVGDVIVDVTMVTPAKMRLGGIFHAARACWALGIPFSLLYVSPQYLDGEIEAYAAALGAQHVRKVGSIVGAPNVVVIREPTEAGSQGYEYLLRDQYRCELDDIDLLKDQLKNAGSEVLLFPGGFDIHHVLNAVGRAGLPIHIDIANTEIPLRDLSQYKIETLIESTSSRRFLADYSENVPKLVDDALSVAGSLVFKENRGGSRIFQRGNSKSPTYIGAQLRPIVHSVGVGDCYDVAYVGLKEERGVEVAANLASCIAAEYAATTIPDDFREGAQACLRSAVPIWDGGVSMPWEARSTHNIYIAAPDFDYNDCSLIDAVADALRYHNFSPRRPVRENGQALGDDSPARKDELLGGDLRLLSDCKLLVAVLIDGDPGTLIEIGLAYGMGIPTIVFDPRRMARNVMLARLPTSVTHTLDETMSEVFRLLAPRAGPR